MKNAYIVLIVLSFCFGETFSSPTYVVSVTGLQVGKSSFTEDFLSLVDSGTSFTTLTDPIYTSISESVST